MVVWGCGRAFLAMPSVLQMRMVSLADEGDGSTGVQSASLDGASTVTLALMFGSLCLVLEHCKNLRTRKMQQRGTTNRIFVLILSENAKNMNQSSAGPYCAVITLFNNIILYFCMPF